MTVQRVIHVGGPHLFDRILFYFIIIISCFECWVTTSSLVMLASLSTEYCQNIFFFNYYSFWNMDVKIFHYVLGALSMVACVGNCYCKWAVWFGKSQNIGFVIWNDLQMNWNKYFFKWKLIWKITTIKIIV